MSDFQPGTKVGYLGGGQLARMLAQSAQNNGLEAHVLCPSKTDPAAQATGYFHQGDLNNQKDLENFLAKVDVATFESEFLNAEILTEAKKNTNATIYPTPELMGILQDRKTQKELFDQNRLPTSLWATVDTKELALDFIDRHGLPVVFKKRFFGYDGYGTFIVKTKKDLLNFLEKDFEEGLFIVEQFIPFKKEVAIIIARSLDESFTHLPFVESFQKDARCDWVKGPYKTKHNKKMLPLLKRFLKKLHYVGVMGVEFFETSKGLIINEIAPRVHNTGHYSLTTEGLSQFDLHNMCLLGQKLPKEIEIKGGFAMANLIGEGGKVHLKPDPALYWYGKADNRQGRKMGHLNGLGKSAKEALNTVLKKRRKYQL